MDLTDQRFGKLLVLRKETLPMSRKGLHYVCQCDCGNLKTVHRNELKSGDTQSCGCLHKQIMADMQYKHGLTKHPIYKSWVGMKNRCLNPDTPSYEIYGGRGISICKEWIESFGYAAILASRAKHIAYSYEQRLQPRQLYMGYSKAAIEQP